MSLKQRVQPPRRSTGGGKVCVSVGAVIGTTGCSTTESKMAYSLHTLALQAPTKSKKGGLLRRMLSPPRLEGIAAPSAARAANAASLVAACFCAALLAAGVGPPPFVELGILGGHLRLRVRVGLAT